MSFHAATTPRWAKRPEAELSAAEREALHDRRRRLMAAATRVLSREGPGAPVSAIAREAGMGISSVYRTFADKDELLDALAAERVGSTAEIWSRALARDDAFEAFADALEDVCSIWADDALLAGILRQRAASGGALARAAGRRAADVRRLLERAKVQGDLNDDVTPEDVRLIITAVTGLACGPPASARSWRRVLELAIAGMRATAR